MGQIDSFRRKWREISFERKIAMFVAPLFVAVATALILRVVVDDGVKGGEAKPEVVSVIVTRDGSRTSPALVDVTLRNVGEVVSVLTRAELEVADFELFRACSLHGAPLEISAKYDVELPGYADEGAVADADLSQELPPNTADRIRLRIFIADGETVGSLEQRIYRLALRLYHDGRSKPLDAGIVLVALTLPSFETSFDVNSAEEKDCARRNLSALAGILRLPGRRSGVLTELGKAKELRTARRMQSGLPAAPTLSTHPPRRRAAVPTHTSGADSLDLM